MNSRSRPLLMLFILGGRPYLCFLYIQKCETVKVSVWQLVVEVKMDVWMIVWVLDVIFKYVYDSIPAIERPFGQIIELQYKIVIQYKLP